MKTSKLQELRATESTLKHNLNTVRDQISKVELKEKLPALKKQYEGKYFTYDNGYNGTDRWILYLHCKKVVRLNTVIVDQFEWKSDGEINFSVNKESGPWILEARITKSKFYKALTAVKNQLKKI